jgi:ParB-like chromosome segregation protein Spo0J
VKLRRVAPDKIKVPEVRVTARFDEETWEQFKSSIKEAGPIAPIICCEVEGELVLVDGLHRLVEAQKNGLKSVDVAVIPGDMLDVLTKNLFLDHMRGKTPVSEMVNVIEVLWKEYGLDSEKIAAKTGMTRDYVEKLQAISQLTPLCRESLDQGRIGVGHAFALTKIKDPDRQEAVMRQQELYHWSVKALEDYIKDVLKIVEEREAALPSQGERPPVKVKCFYCRGEYDPSEVANPNTCRFCSGVLLTAITQAERESKSEGEPQNEG